MSAIWRLTECNTFLCFMFRALKDAERAIALAPDWPKGYFRKGRALAGLKVSFYMMRFIFYLCNINCWGSTPEVFTCYLLFDEVIFNLRFIENRKVVSVAIYFVCRYLLLRWRCTPNRNRPSFMCSNSTRSVMMQCRNSSGYAPNSWR